MDGQPNSVEDSSSSLLTIITIISTTLAVVIGIVVYFLTKKYKITSKKSSVLITGISGVGKTALYLCLQNDTTSATCTSMQENIGSCNNSATEKAVEIIDIPGYSKVRGVYLKYLNVAKCIIFVVSSSDIKKSFKDDAAYLHDIILSNTENIPVLILCNKIDIPMSESDDVVKLILEKELNKLRKRTAKPGEVISDEDMYMYGDPDDDFHFEQLTTQIVFAQSSVKENDISSVWSFLNMVGLK
ncbi:Signal recognition particle receptor subunit beta [Entamoeba marina]